MDKELKYILDKYPRKEQRQIIPVLQDIQDKFGMISEEHLNALSKEFKIPCSKIYSIATYYNQFSFSSDYKVNIKICEGSACYIHNGADLMRELTKQLDIDKNDVSSDGIFRIVRVPCFGACNLAPVIEIDGTFYIELNKKSLSKIIKEIKLKYSNAGV